MAIQDFNLANLDGGNGFRLDGDGNVFFLARSVSDAGDVNGDGIDDVITGSSTGNVVFGRDAGFGAGVDLSDLNGNDGFRLEGINGNDGYDYVVSSAGDVNGDGFDDVIMGGYRADSNGKDSGSSYVLFGKATGFDASIPLTSLDGSNGFRLDGGQDYDLSGKSVSGAGDINGDGFDDVIIGAPDANSNGENSGSSYVLFGKAAGFDAQIQLADLDGSNGFRLDGVQVRDYSGISVSSAGDVNGDGLDDMIIGAQYADSNDPDSGSCYVVFGQTSGFGAQFDLSRLDGSNGFRLNGEQADEQLGQSVSSAGDINGDGLADVIIGAGWANLNGQFSGESYVVFGRTSGFDAQLNVSSLNGQNGFRLDGEFAFDHAGASVSSAGDVNGDGLDDLIVGAHGASVYNFSAGASYLVFGRKSGFDAHISLSDIDGRNGVRLTNPDFFENMGQSVSGAGDINHDGFDDVIVGAGNASYVIFGGTDIAGAAALIPIQGTATDDDLQGTQAAEYLGGGAGNDTLTGTGGADKLDGGEGDDIIRIADADFAAIDGGEGEDTLKFQGSDLNLDLAQLASRIHYVETFDMQGAGNNTLTLTSDSTLQIQGHSSSDTTIRGDSGDRVVLLDRDWRDGGVTDGYHTYFHPTSSILRVQEQVTVDLARSESDIQVSQLDGSNGFSINLGGSVSNAGDVNGDGIDDVILGNFLNDYNGSNSGSGYVVFGKSSGFDAHVDLSNLDGSNGFRLDGVKEEDFAGISVSAAGDVNSDGYGDLIIGATNADPNGIASGSSYVVFGKASGFDAHINLSSLDGQNGFRLDGESAYAGSGISVSDVGDVNGDGFGDVIVETSGISSYVVFGKASGFAAQLNLSSLDGSDGFRFDREGENNAGHAVSGAGDVNGDGFDDVIIGDHYGGSFDGTYSGTSYVVFGQASGFEAHIDSSSLDGKNGFRMRGADNNDHTGGSVSGAGDINGDGFDDVIVGADGAGGSYDNGASYVVFGRASGFDAQIDLAELDGNNGFRLEGGELSSHFGHSVSSAGDINGDGFDDLIIGTSSDYGYGHFYSETPSYVIFGKASGFDAILSMDDLDHDAGFRIDNGFQKDLLGSTVSGAGDVNDDGLDDLILNAPESGSSYVIFGSRDFGNGGGGGGELPEIKGTEGDDTLKGSTEAEHFIAGDGNDNLLGRGGADVFDAGAGNDAIRIGDLTFASVDGGEGNDALHLAGADLNLDLTALGSNIHSIETICLYGRGDNTLTLNADSLLDLSDSTNTLKVHGNSGDHIAVHGTDWVDGGVHGFYHSYTHDDAVLLVGANVTVEFV